MQGFDWATLLGQYWLSFVVESVHDHLRVCDLVFNIIPTVVIQKNLVKLS